MPTTDVTGQYRTGAAARLARWAALLVTALLLACEGPRGPRGADAEPGAMGADGSPGSPGERGPAGPRGPGTITDATVAVPPSGMAGMVRDGSGQSVGSGRVVLVPAAEIARLVEGDLDLSLPGPEAASVLGDEPVEDVIDVLGAALASAQVQADGTYRFEEIPQEAHVVVFVPADDDRYHLPGGNLARVALEHDSLEAARLDLTVSGRASDDASYVGSAACLTCHGRHRVTRSAHFVGLMVPGAPGALQDAAHYPEIGRALSLFDAETTLYFARCEAEGEARCEVTDSDPGDDVRFELHLERDFSYRLGELGALTATFENRQGAGTRRYPVALSYGGTLSRQQLLVQVQTESEVGATHQVLPFSINLQGYETALDPADWPYRDDHSERWFDAGEASLREPAPEDAFDVACAGCHYTGLKQLGSREGWRASAVASSDGSYDADGDGRLEEVGVGCERCHGPGSEHLEHVPRGTRIVSPSRLTPERALLICGACHSRDSSPRPMVLAQSLPRPGMRRAEYLRSRSAELPSDASWANSGDARGHGQQYLDFVRSGKHRNARQMLVCESCHDPHGSDAQPHDLARSLEDGAVCTECHSADAFRDVRTHVEAATGNPHLGSDLSELRCPVCHMVATGTGGAQRRALLDVFPRDATQVQYLHGDRSSHRFRHHDRSEVGRQPTPFTQGCAVCHGVSLPNP